ncbi:SGNH/GDSL hydrolase family protein [Pseudanabaena sp. FACHB-2040]|uniref:SGNH/GDSL hydrolase family protein n=1 Tax=Pseudanabaena sp. FACHB-2040 TaxID=2692859 RepID=UPI0016862E76|nr:SGNH/GDSL hydrolase family protein [Pseudanabaena sp. FACHB-2040]MBD2256127.1 SGNH/GDSL hydrolase family protein [Pseudanabaena sp. FACHB-2040]
MSHLNFLHPLTRILWGSALSLSLATLVPAAAEAASFGRLFVFGDSLSDTGNTAAVTGGIVPPPILPGIDLSTGFFGALPAYTQQRFADELIWLDFLAPQLGATSGQNFAFAGATTGFLNTTSPALPGLQQQIGQYLSLKIPAATDDLFVLWAGNNDYLEVAGQTDPTVPVSNLESAIRTLAGVGAENFLVVNLPDLGQTPLVKNRQNAPQVTGLVEQHNALLASTLASLDQDPSFDGVDLISLDVFSLIESALVSPGQFGFTNVSDPCLTTSPLFFPPDTKNPPITRCANPDEYLFWDSLHPTSKAHQIVASAALQALDQAPASVPEPSSGVALMVLSGGLALVRTRRQKKSDVA